MWMVWPFCLFFFVAPALAEFSFSEKYERDYTILNPASQYATHNLLNLADRPMSPTFQPLQS